MSACYGVKRKCEFTRLLFGVTFTPLFVGCVNFTLLFIKIESLHRSKKRVRVSV